MTVRCRRAAPVIVAAGVFKFGDQRREFAGVSGNEKMVTVRPLQPQIVADSFELDTAKKSGANPEGIGLRAIARLFVEAGNSFATKPFTRHLETTSCRSWRLQKPSPEKSSVPEPGPIVNGSLNDYLRSQVESLVQDATEAAVPHRELDRFVTDSDKHSPKARCDAVEPLGGIHEIPRCLNQG
jgi:hypothetical protein